ncbi:MAG: ABC transporter ATP-binding protein [Herminiimonas sp.]|nr:ABC transporter ATP-binding protein [Herminiimonas sp.]
MTAPSPLLECRQLRLQAGQRVLIDALDWHVNQGELWCVLGANGVGKSTLLYSLAGLRPMAQGRIEIAGRALDEWSLAALAHQRGLMQQQQADAFSASALEAVLVGRTPHRVAATWDAAEDIEVARHALASVGMQDFAGADILQLSGGERQRIALATLLAQAPAIMLLDEPTSHQDVAQQLRMMRLLGRLADQHAVVVTCHDINLAARFATHVLLLAPGGVRSGVSGSVLTTANLSEAYGCTFEMVETADHRRGFVAS